MLAACASMARSAENPDLVNKIAFLHKNLFSRKSKLTMIINLSSEPMDFLSKLLAKFFRHILF